MSVNNRQSDMAILNRAGKPAFFRFSAVMRILLMLIAFAASSGPSLTHSQARRAGEYRHKATFTLHFIRFTQWPEGTFESADDPVLVNVMYDIPACETLQNTLDGEFVNLRRVKRELRVKRVKLATDILTCHVFYFGTTDKAMIQNQLDAIGGRPILTIGETRGFLEMGGIINFDEQSRKRFSVNITAAQRAGLKLSSQLLRSAEIYTEPEIEPGEGSLDDAGEKESEGGAPGRAEEESESEDWKKKLFFHRRFKLK